MESSVNHAELLGITDNAPLPTGKNRNCKLSEKVEYRNRQLILRDKNVIIRHFADNREAHLNQDEKAMTAGKIVSAVDETYLSKIRIILSMQEAMWTGELGESGRTEHRINLIHSATPFKSPPYRTGPKTIEQERFKVQK